MHSPTVDGRVIDRDAALGHHLLKIAQAEIVGQVPPDAEQVIDRSKCRPLNTLLSAVEPGRIS